MITQSLRCSRLARRAGPRRALREEAVGGSGVAIVHGQRKAGAQDARRKTGAEVADADEADALDAAHQ